jgi:hypothetical protein
MSLQTLVSQINTAASKYGVPPNILLGVMGMETAFGNNVKTSSAGAVGLMQFEPATAAQYGYPLTNTPTPAQAQQQIDAAAAKLSHDAGPSKNWSQAITAYGGGYTLAQVQAKAQSALGTSGAQSYFGGLGPGNDGLTPNVSIPNPLSSVGNAIGTVFNTAVTDAKFAAVSLGMLLLGAMLMFRAFSSSGGGAPKAVPVPV